MQQVLIWMIEDFGRVQGDDRAAETEAHKRNSRIFGVVKSWPDLLLQM